jgi:ubiquinone/menaquinone biosynthesis C-methylase UbiE
MSDKDQAKPTGAGKSSFDLIDKDTFFQEVDLRQGITFLDVACGRGLYSLAVADRIGPSGTVVAVDLWEEGIGLVRAEAAARRVSNIRAHVSDVSRKIPVESRSVDLSMLATVLHDFVLDGIADRVLPEVVRVMKSTGKLVIVEFKKINGPPGPPITSRLSPDEVEKILAPYGFQKRSFADLGPCTYLMQFGSQGS